MLLRVRVRCQHLIRDAHGNETVNFLPLPHADNAEWTAAPVGTFTFTISKSEAQNRFEPGKEYFLDLDAAT